MPSSSKTHHYRFSLLERLTLAHVGVFFAGATWAFGGNALALQPLLAWWGSLGVLLTLSAALGREDSQIDARPLLWLLPLGLFNALVLVSTLTPGFHALKSGADTMLVPRDLSVWIPTAAIPSDARYALWLFDAIYLSCFNVALIVKRRSAVRGLLLFAALNALALAVFGTLQELVHANGLFFGAVKIRQTYFFASFIYHNHWAAFAVLMAAVCLGLSWRYARHAGDRGFWHTPGFGTLAIIPLLAATEPLSASRSGSGLMFLLLLGAFIHWTLRLVRRRRRDHASAVLPLAGAAIAILVSIAGTWYLASDTILARVALTEQQIGVMQTEGGLGSRHALYRDTWHMATDRPWFGWGMASYPYVFMIYNTQEPNRIDHLPIFYSAAHNDWLQSLAENGFIGTAILGCCGLVPLLGLRRSQLFNLLTLYLLAGCGLILLYAWVEFPFGNIAVVLTWWLCYFCGVRYAYLHDLEDQTLQA